MPGPFRFFKPADVDQTGYDSGVNRQTLGVGRVSEVALSGQDVETLEVTPNDPSVTHVDEATSWNANERRFRLTGTKPGDAMLEAKDDTNAVVAYMQVHVDQAPPSLGPPVSAAPRTGGQSATKFNATLRTSPFPSTYASFSPDTRLQAALNAAMATEPAQYQSMTTAIVALNSDGTRPLAHHRGAEVHYGASMNKLAAMYAAFELRATLRSIADELGSGVRQHEVLQQASAYLDPKIMAWVATIGSTTPPLASAAAGHALPRYASMFDVVPKSGVPGLTVNFSANYKAALDQMMGPSSNNDAAKCIHGVGYGYLNGALAAAGFFNPGTKSGIWLAGDYQEPPGSKGKYPYYRIPCLNDVDTAQGATAVQVARLMALLSDRVLVGSAASVEMLDIMTKPPAGEWYSHQGPSATGKFRITNVKIGYGPLKSAQGGYPVLSEASLIRHMASAPNRIYAVGWLNMPNAWPLEAISSRLAKTFDNYRYP